MQNYYAILKIPKESLSSKEKQRLSNELNCLKNLRHENIIKLYGHYKNIDDTYIIVLEYSEGNLKILKFELINYNFDVENYEQVQNSYENRKLYKYYI